MYYSVEILKKSGKFGTIWAAATNPSVLTKKDYAEVNIIKTCNDIIEHLLVGTIRTKTKQYRAQFSLYLSSQLMIGVWRVYSKQNEYLLNDSFTFYKHLGTFKIFSIDLPSTKTLAQPTTLRDPLNNTMLICDDFGEIAPMMADDYIHWPTSFHDISVLSTFSGKAHSKRSILDLDTSFILSQSSQASGLKGSKKGKEQRGGDFTSNLKDQLINTSVSASLIADPKTISMTEVERELRIQIPFEEELPALNQKDMEELLNEDDAVTVYNDPNNMSINIHDDYNDHISLKDADPILDTFNRETTPQHEKPLGLIDLTSIYQNGKAAPSPKKTPENNTGDNVKHIRKKTKRQNNYVLELLPLRKTDLLSTAKKSKRIRKSSPRSDPRTTLSKEYMQATMKQSNIFCFEPYQVKINLAQFKVYNPLNPTTNTALIHLLNPILLNNLTCGTYMKGPGISLGSKVLRALFDQGKMSEERPEDIEGNLLPSSDPSSSSSGGSKPSSAKFEVSYPEQHRVSSIDKLRKEASNLSKSNRSLNVTGLESVPYQQSKGGSQASSIHSDYHGSMIENMEIEQFSLGDIHEMPEVDLHRTTSSSSLSERGQSSNSLLNLVKSKLFYTTLDKEGQSTFTVDSVSFKDLAPTESTDRKSAARLFRDMLGLIKRGYIKPTQHVPYGTIILKRGAVAF